MTLRAKDEELITTRLNLTLAPSSCNARFNFFTCTKLPAKSRRRKGITNHTGDLNFSGAFTVDVDDRKSLVTLVKTIHEINQKRIKKAEAENQQIRARNAKRLKRKSSEALEKEVAPNLVTTRIAAGGHTDEEGLATKNSDTWSLTPGIEADVVIRLTGKEFCEVKQSDQDKGRNIVSTGPNICVGDFHKLIERQFGLVMKTASLIPWVTIGGLVGNPCHGTGIDAMAMAGYVEELELLKPDGEFEIVKSDHPDFKSIVGSNFGLFGIITNVKLRCIPAQKLEVTQKQFNFYDLIHEIKTNGTQGILASPYTSIMWIPTSQKNETESTCDKNIRIIEMKPVPLETKNVNFPPKGLNSPLAQEIMIDINDDLHISDFLAAHPSLIVPYMKHIVAKVEVDEATPHSVGNWPVQWHFQTSYPADKLADDDFEFSIKLEEEKTFDPNPVPKGPLRLVQFLENVAALLKKFPPSIMDAIYIRFNKGYNGGLNPGVCAADEIVVAFDIVSSPKIPNYAAFRKAFQEMALAFGARPHPGKFLPAGIDYAKMYGENYTKYCEALKKWYPIEQNPFINGMMQTMLKDGIEFKPKQQLEEKRAVLEEKQHALLPHQPKPAGSPSQHKAYAKKLLEEIGDPEHPHTAEWKNHLEEFVHGKPEQKVAKHVSFLSPQVQRRPSIVLELPEGNTVTFHR